MEIFQVIFYDTPLRCWFVSLADYTIHRPNRVEKSAGGPHSLAAATELIRTAKNPVILAGGGVVIGEATNEVKALAEYLNAPVCTTYLRAEPIVSLRMWMPSVLEM